MLTNILWKSRPGPCLFKKDSDLMTESINNHIKRYLVAAPDLNSPKFSLQIQISILLLKFILFTSSVHKYGTPITIFYFYRYKEVCPYPDPSFTQVTKYLDVPETLITDFTSGSTYHIQVG